MKKPIAIVIFFSLTLFSIQAVATKTAKSLSAMVFIDSADVKQQSLVIDINQTLYYSATLSSQLRVTVIDVNPNGRAFNGAVDYSFDSTGEWVAKYRPGGLPYLICFQGDKAIHKQGLYQASGIRECTTKG